VLFALLLRGEVRVSCQFSLDKLVVVGMKYLEFGKGRLKVQESAESRANRCRNKCSSSSYDSLRMAKRGLSRLG
jgi:hypothetical protein